MSKHVTLIYDDAVAVTASDTTDDPAGPFAAIDTGSGGTIKVRTLRGTDLTLVNRPAGVILPLAVKRVYSSVTTATSIMGYYNGEYHGPRPSA